MVTHLSTPKSQCAAYANEQRHRHVEMASLGRYLGIQGIRASSESCGHRGCTNAAVLTGLCSNCGGVNLFCPEHSYCCKCHHWYHPSSVQIDEDCCPYVSCKDHCRPGHVCGVCDGSLPEPKDTKSVRLRAIIGQPVIKVRGDDWATVWPLVNQ